MSDIKIKFKGIELEKIESDKVLIEKTLPATPGIPDLKAESARHCCLDCRHWLPNDSTFEHGLCRAVDHVISRNTSFASVCDAFKGM